MAILFCDDSYRSDKIFSLLQENMPGIDLRKHPQTGSGQDIDYAIILRPHPGCLQNLPNLKLVFTIGAGVDGIIHDTTLPDVPIIRNTDPHLAHGIRDYVVHHVLRYHRFFDIYQRQQHDATWKQYPQLPQATRSIGIMGAGKMAMPAILALQALGFNVRCWSRTVKDIPGVTTFHGKDQLPEFLSGTEMLVNILPLTDETRGILNAELFAQLPQNAFVINVGRGAHVVDNDLLAALDSNHLKAATLDAFVIEPLAQDHPFWSHPKITITPHIASLTDYANISKNIARVIDAFERDGTLPQTVDRKKQY